MSVSPVDLLSELECPVCTEYMLPPIGLCENGHSVCSACRPRLKKCPSCNAKFTTVRSLVLERVASRMLYPCQFGCGDGLKLEDMLHHLGECPLKPYKCPFFLVDNCLWQGPAAFIQEHVRKDHGASGDTREVSGVYTTSIPELGSNSSWCQAVFTLGELFFAITVTTEDRTLYSCIQHVGLANDATKFKYKLSFKTADDSACFTDCHVTPSYLADVNAIFRKESCVVLRHAFVKRCLDSNDVLNFEEEIIKIYEPEKE